MQAPLIVHRSLTCPALHALPVKYLGNPFSIASCLLVSFTARSPTYTRQIRILGWVGIEVNGVAEIFVGRGDRRFASARPGVAGWGAALGWRPARRVPRPGLALRCAVGRLAGSLPGCGGLAVRLLLAVDRGRSVGLWQYLNGNCTRHSLPAGHHRPQRRSQRSQRVTTLPIDRAGLLRGL